MNAESCFDGNSEVEKFEKYSLFYRWKGQETLLVLSYCPSSTICCLGNLGRFFDFLKSQFSHLYNGRTRPIYFIDGSVQWDNMSKALGKQTRVHIH